MRINVRDNVKTAHGNRQDYLTTQVETNLSRFGTSVHQVDVTMNLEGHDETAVTQCHLTACLGSLGVVVAEQKNGNDHLAFKGAMDRLMRGIGRRIGKRQSRRHHADPVAIPITG